MAASIQLTDKATGKILEEQEGSFESLVDIRVSQEAREALAKPAIPPAELQDSGVSDSSIDPYEQAGLSKERVAEIKKKQESLRKDLGEMIAEVSDSLEYSISIPTPESIDILPSELEGTPEQPEIPLQFLMDYVTAARNHYVRIEFEGVAPLVVRNQDTAEALLSTCQAFARSISDKRDSEVELKKLERVVALATTQILPVMVCGPVMEDHAEKKLGSRYGEDGDFDTTPELTIIKFTPVRLEGQRRKPGAFNIEVESLITTAHRTIKKDQITEEQLEARKALGIAPVLTSKVRASVICARNTAGEYAFSAFRTQALTTARFRGFR